MTRSVLWLSKGMLQFCYGGKLASQHSILQPRHANRRLQWLLLIHSALAPWQTWQWVLLLQCILQSPCCSTLCSPPRWRVQAGCALESPHHPPSWPSALSSWLAVG